MSSKQAKEQDGFRRLSDSPIWDLQRTYYRQMGPDAWQPNAVPSYITTNPFIARCYAKVIDGFFKDFAKPQPVKRRENTQYILELGAGSGRFAYRFLKHFHSTEEVAIRRKQDIVYVMTDISEANITFWRSHPQLKPFIDQGLVDFAYLDVMNSHSIHLLISGRKIALGSLSTPLGVIANYVIDSVPHDLFSLAGNKLKARLVKHSIMPGDETIAAIVRNTEFDYSEEACSLPFYDNADWNRILGSYKKTKESFHFSLPVGGFQVIDRMSALTTGPMFLLTGDFGATDMSELKSLPPRHVVRNGTYSLHVNFHALSKYVENKRGQVFLAGHSKSSLEIAGFLLRAGRRKPKHTNREFEAHIRKFGPDEFFALKKIVEDNFNGLSLPRILALLRMSCWDTKFFNGCADALSRALPEASAFERDSVVEALNNVESMHFRCSRAEDPTLSILKLLCCIGEQDAIFAVIRKNEKYLRSSDSGLLAIAEAYQQFGKRKEAVKIINSQLARNPGHPQALLIQSRIQGDIA